MRLIFFGPPGVGKGTQAKLISEMVRIPQISTGEILRSAITAKTELGIEAEKYMNQGQLVPDNLIMDMITLVLERPENANGFILDGFPRTVPQAKGLHELLKKLKMSLDSVVQLVVPEEVIVTRLVNRRICSFCGMEHNLIYKPIPEDGKCANCGNMEFIQRPDDNEETIRKRLNIYHRSTTPVLVFFEKLNVLRKIEGAQVVNKVTEDIVAALKIKVE